MAAAAIDTAKPLGAVNAALRKEIIILTSMVKLSTSLFVTETSRSLGPNESRPFHPVLIVEPTAEMTRGGRNG
jgi:hypothetical protein